MAKTTLERFGGFAPAAGQAPRVDSLGSLRRQTLVGLRWGAVTGQILALIIVSRVLGFSYPVLACSLTILASVLVNLAEFDGPRSPEAFFKRALREKGAVFIGVRVAPVELRRALDRATDSYTEAAAHLAGARQKG